MIFYLEHSKNSHATHIQEEMVSVPGYYNLNRAEQRMPSVSLFVRYVFKGGDRKMAQIEERESLMESEKDAVPRK
jgi:hypothetical protein